MPWILPKSPSGRPDRMETLQEYQLRGGYQALAQALTMSPSGIIEQVTASGLRGRGGGAYPTGNKWQAVAQTPADQHYLVVNGAEGEPGSFKDRTLMAQAPHLVLEGILIAARAIAANEILFYVNDEFTSSLASLRHALAESEAAGWLGPQGQVPVSVTLYPETHVYLAGEETALINVLMGRPPQPWHRPPYPTQRGYRDMPTLVNNVETLAMIPLILRLGPEWFRDHYPMLFSLSGDVRRPGVYEMGLGARLDELLAAGGGAHPGRTIQAVLPGGYSMPMIGAEHFGVTLDYASLKSVGSGLGASIIAVDSSQRVEAVATTIMEFFARTTCGKCPVCVKATHTMAEAWEELPATGLDDARSQSFRAYAEHYRHKGICSFLDTAALLSETSVQFIQQQELHLHRR